MRKRAVIDSEQLPLRSPLGAGILWALALDYWRAPGWLWGVLGCVWVLLSVVWFLDRWNMVEKKVELKD